ncbi:MOSC domain-containing protein [Microlunatus speluncae]|uniref:MOSC domain-containing protein n=1 Tax=Microlunatus speluncae TaxID=2594267 RepID=UPI001C2CD3DF|nr:MOSC N-terminal beta barrel domain-containing protein [Microlunatus speluncae]
MDNAADGVAARLARIWRYPVKSMAGESLESAAVSWHGLAGDRRWAFVRPDHESNGFPWHTIREEPRMWLYSARLRDPGRPDASTAEVLTPAGETLEVTDPALAEQLGARLRLMRLHRGAFDTMPVSLIGSATAAELCRTAGLPVDPRRFRPNLLVETDEPFVEDSWVGRTLRIGDAVLRVDRSDKRCVAINVDPETGQVSPELLRLVAKTRGSAAGVYATVVVPAEVRVAADILFV